MFLSKISILLSTITQCFEKKKHFCCYCLHAFNTEEILKLHIKDWFKINRNLRILMPKKVNMLHLKIIEEKSHCL